MSANYREKLAAAIPGTLRQAAKTPILVTFETNSPARFYRGFFWEVP
jgi:hypothetical protein